MAGEGVIDPPQEFIKVLRDGLNVPELAIPANLREPPGDGQRGWIKAAYWNQISGKRLARCRVDDPDYLTRLRIVRIVPVQQGREIAVQIGNGGHRSGLGRSVANESTLISGKKE